MRKSPSASVLAYFLLAIPATMQLASQVKTSVLAQKPQNAVTQSAKQPHLLLRPTTSTTVVPNQTVDFTLTWDPNNSCSAPNQFIYLFDWGDKTAIKPSVAKAGSHQYLRAGSYPVRVNARPNPSVKIAEGCRDSILSNQVTVTVRAPALFAQAINFPQPTSPVTYFSGLQILLAATGGESGNPVVFTIDQSSTGAATTSANTLTVTSVGTF